MRFFIKMLLVTASIGFSQSSLAVNLKILALGDSITASVEAPKSYRYLLQDQLNAAGHTFDFFGTQSGDNDGLSNIVQRAGYDNDHEGHPSEPTGFFTENVSRAGLTGSDKSMLNGFLTLDYSSAPDVALVHIGTNDATGARFHNSSPTPNEALTAALTNIDKIISTLKGSNPNMKIFLAEIIPFGPDFNAGDPNERNGAELNTSFIDQFNAGVSNIANNDSSIFAVNMHDGFLNSDNSVNTSLFVDNVHPTQAGEQILADRFFNALDASGSLTAVPLPPALYLFGAAVFGLFSVGRRKEAS